VIYGRDLAKSARRHFVAADRLVSDTLPSSTQGNRAVAGYVYGIAGELALKELMRLAGIRELSDRKQDPFFAHFPHIKTLIKNGAAGRRAQVLLKHALNDRLFHDWDTAMRYAPTTDVKSSWIDDWKADAETLVNEMNS